MHDLVVIGGGPAGLAATAYALEKHLDVALVCARLGGRAGPNWEGLTGADLLGSDTVAGLRRRVAARPECIVHDTVVGVMSGESGFAVVGEQHTLYTRAVLLAAGTQPIMLGLPGEGDLFGHGLSYSVETYAPLVVGQPVAVVGGNRRALRGAAELLQQGARVLLVTPEEGQLAGALGRHLRAHADVELLEGYRVQAIEPAENGLHRLVATRGSLTRRATVAAVFVALGLVPGSQPVRQIAAVDPHGFLVVDAHNQTSQPGLFAAGDVTTMFAEHSLIAVGDGVRAAMRAYDYLLADVMRNT
ncbi:MAG TPA: NAD(P)/FAD-dependent oxidoreductase [Roseiflexaceae bacterium]|nr:NAD(P)/FAD-dependent oxidoreductase [Roseiflexaceae bacterium]